MHSVFFVFHIILVKAETASTADTVTMPQVGWSEVRFMEEAKFLLLGPFYTLDEFYNWSTISELQAAFS